MSPATALAVTAGVAVPLLIAGVPGLYHLHKWLSRVENSLAVVETRSVQLTKNSGSHVADVPEAVRRVERKLDAVRADALSAAAAVAMRLEQSQAEATVHRNVIASEQHRTNQSVEVLMTALEQHARDEYRKEVAYVKALRHYNIDLTDITQHLDTDDVTDVT